MRSREVAILVSGCAGLAVLSLALIYRVRPPRLVTSVSGAVLRDEGDPDKQRPVESAVITASSGRTFAEATSDAAGFFRLTLRPPVVPGDEITFTLKHPGYEPLEITGPARDEIQILRCRPNSRTGQTPQPRISISNVRVRYALRGTTTVDVGSLARTFEAVNTGNVPCLGRHPCSPDGKWKAALGSISLDAGAGKQYRNVRISCIAGPCPFSRIEADRQTENGRLINVTVRNWSDTVTYLLEAEVADTLVSETVRHSYPAIFGRAMNFTLPAAGEGPSIEAELDGAEIIFPLGPRARLTWADCRVEPGSNGSRLFRCELKPDYQFR